MVDCQFMKIREFKTNSKNSKLKLGRYHRSWFPKKGYGYACWAVVANIEVNKIDELLDEMATKDIAKECLNKLNAPPTRKRKTKKPPKNPYGDVELHNAYLKEGEAGKYIQVIFFTDQKKNKYFWGSGPTGGRIAKRKKRN